MKNIIRIFIIIFIIIGLTGCISSNNGNTPHAEKGDIELSISLSKNILNMTNESELTLEISVKNIASHNIKLSEYYDCEIAIRLFYNNTEYVMQRTMPDVAEVEFITIKKGETKTTKFNLFYAVFFPMNSDLDRIEFPNVGSYEIYCKSPWSEDSNHLNFEIIA